MGSGVPLLNEYKQEFLWKRLPQTVLGGAKLRLGYDAPCYVYLSQVALFVLPWVFSATLTPLVHFDVIRYDVGIYVISGLVLVYVLLVNGVSAYKKRTEAAISAVTRTAQNVLAEEDEVEFTACCGVEAVTFVIPGKKFVVNIFLHATLSAALCGLSFWYLLPSTLNSLFSDNLGVTLTLHVLGWFSTCVAQYSLTVAAPPEPATYSADDPYELAPLMRPFYCFLCFTLDLLARFYSSSFVAANQVGHIVLVTLPLLWTVGLLPPLNAFITWLVEQTVVFIFGGSPMASDVRSLLMLVVSSGAFLLTYFVPYMMWHAASTAVVMATLGYLLSLDLGLLMAQLEKRACYQHRKPESNEVLVTDQFLWRWSPHELGFHLLMLLVSGGLAGTLNALVAPSGGWMSDYFLYSVMGLLVLEHLLRDIQTVYVFLGLWRNKLYPSSAQRTTIFHKAKTRLKPVGYIRRLLRNFVAPLLMLSWLAISITFEANTTTSSTSQSTNTSNITSNSSGVTAAHILGVHRTYRWLWQNTVCCMLDLTLYQLLRLVLPASGWWRALPAGVQLLLVSVFRDRAEQLLHKLYVYCMLLVTSWTDKKQRRRSTAPVMAANLLLLPVVLGVLALSAGLSAPALPLFTLPVFLAGYPRPRRGWPGQVGASANTCPDTVYYRHLAAPLARALRIAAANGSIGEPAAGTHYLVRFQDRLTWVQVLERGYLYFCVSIKGLELQETSCHTLEATRIDDIFEVTFEREGGTGCCTWTQHPLNVLRPYDAAYIKTYSDARNQLTGVIDSPDSLRLIGDGFVQALVWVLLHHCQEKKRRGDIYLARPGTGRTKTPAQVGRTNSSSHWEKLDEGEISKPKSVSKGAASARIRKSQSRKPSAGLGDDWTLDEDPNNVGWEQTTQSKNQRNARPVSGRSRGNSAHSRKTTTSLRSLNDSWASDNESLILEELDVKKKPNLVTLNAARQLEPSAIVRDESDPGTVLPPLREDQQRRHVARLPGLLPETVSDDRDDDTQGTPEFFNDLDFGLPAMDVNQPHRPPPESHVSFSSHLTGKSDPRTPNQVQLTSLSESLHFASLYSRLVSPAMHWRESPLEARQLAPLLDKFPKAWYRHIISIMHFDVESGNTDVASEIAKDTALEEVYRRLVMSCYGTVNVLGSSITDVVSLGPTHVHKMYSGDIPWSPAASWMQDDEELLSLVIKAFRYGVKLAIDQVLLGEVSSLEELQTYMEEYQRDYYIGLETDPGWTEAILKSTPNLFSLNYIPTQGTFSSRVLTLQDLVVHMGSVSQEAVRGQWANLALELLYMTNDDEERNSIQAHATLLRNLTVQAADPPLGYPVFASTPVSIPTL